MQQLEDKLQSEAFDESDFVGNGKIKREQLLFSPFLICIFHHRFICCLSSLVSTIYRIN